MYIFRENVVPRHITQHVRRELADVLIGRLEAKIYPTTVSTTKREKKKKKQSKGEICFDELFLERVG